jgi:uncharacterized protein (TIGR03435 family)
MRLSIVAVVLCLPVWAQPAKGPQFEVASVKPNPAVEMSVLLPGKARLRGRHASLTQLISFAYDLSYARINGPSWLNSEHFDVEAKGPAGATDADLRLMTRALLAERFGLQCHRETKEARVFLLVSAGGVSKMTPADEPQRPHPKFPPGPHRTMGGDGTMEELAAQLSRAAAVPVIDRTGIAGKFHYYLWWGDSQETDPDLFQAVKEQLGLKLQPASSDVEFLVIDRVSKTPSAN